MSKPETEPKTREIRISEETYELLERIAAEEGLTPEGAAQRIVSGHLRGFEAQPSRSFAEKLEDYERKSRSLASIKGWLNTLRSWEDIALICVEIVNNSESLEEARDKMVYIAECAQERQILEFLDYMKRSLGVLREIP